jgi:hypothetical protein
VPSYTPSTKNSARSAQEAAEWTRSACGALGIEGSPRYLYAAAFFDLLARVTKRIAEDPARSDFTTSTHVRPQFATPQYIQAEERSESLALEAAETADHAEAYLAAHLRAFERMQGALKADRASEASQREEEAIKHARAGGGALQALAARLEDMVEAISVEPRREIGADEIRTGRPQRTDVSTEALAVLFLGGLRIRDLEKVLRGTRLEDSRVAPNRFRSASTAFQRFGSAMTEWNPPRESELSL